MRVPLDGGVVQAVTRVDVSAGEASHAWPDVLPGGRALVFTVVGADGAVQVVAQRIGANERRVIVPGAARARYIPSGYLVFGKAGEVLAARFDPERLELLGPAARLAAPVWMGLEQSPWFDISNDGLLVNAEGSPADRRSLAWVDRRGRVTPLSAPAREYRFPALSPDGLGIAVHVIDRGRANIWHYAIPTGALTSVSSTGFASAPIWSRDGRAITYSSNSGTGNEMWVQPPIGAVPATGLFSSPRPMWPGSWFSDGKRLAYMSGNNGGDIVMYETAGHRETPVVSTPDTEWGARLSPNDRWLAYVSNESGQWEVMVRRVDAVAGATRVSTNGGTEVVWARDGRTLFYRNRGKLMSVAIDATATLTVGETTELFDMPAVVGSPGLPAYDVAADGSRFLIVLPGPSEVPLSTLQMTSGWTRLVAPR